MKAGALLVITVLSLFVALRRASPGERRLFFLDTALSGSVWLDRGILRASFEYDDLAEEISQALSIAGSGSETIYVQDYTGLLFFARRLQEVDYSRDVRSLDSIGMTIRSPDDCGLELKKALDRGAILLLSQAKVGDPPLDACEERFPGEINERMRAFKSFVGPGNRALSLVRKK